MRWFLLPTLMVLAVCCYGQPLDLWGMDNDLEKPDSVSCAFTILDPQNTLADTIPIRVNREISGGIDITRLYAKCDSSGYSFEIGSRAFNGGTITVIDTLTLETAGINCYYDENYLIEDVGIYSLPDSCELWFRSLGSEDPTYLLFEIRYTLD